MTDFHPDAKAFAGETTRPKPWLTLGPTGARQATTAVTAIGLAGEAGYRHEVHAAWSTAQAGALTNHSDTIYCRDQELARAVALAADDAFRGSREFDLLALEQALKRRGS